MDSKVLGSGKLPTSLDPTQLKKARIRVALFGTAFALASIGMCTLITWLIHSRVDLEMQQSFFSSSRLQQMLIEKELQHVEALLAVTAAGVAALPQAHVNRVSMDKILSQPRGSRLSTLSFVGWRGVFQPPCGQRQFHEVLEDYGLPLNTSAILLGESRGQRFVVDLTVNSTESLVYRSDMPLDVYGDGVVATGLPLFIDNSGTSSRGPAGRLAIETGNITAAEPDVLSIGLTGVVAFAPLQWTNATLDPACNGAGAPTAGDHRGTVVATLWGEMATTNVRRATREHDSSLSGRGQQVWFEVLDASSGRPFMRTSDLEPIAPWGATGVSFRTWYNTEDFISAATFTAFGRNWIFHSVPSEEFFDSASTDLPSFALGISLGLLAVLCSLLVYTFWQRETRILGSDLKRTVAEAEVAVHEHVVGIIHHELKNPLHIILAAHESLRANLLDDQEANSATSASGGGGEVKHGSQPPPQPHAPAGSSKSKEKSKSFADPPFSSEATFSTPNKFGFPNANRSIPVVTAKSLESGSIRVKFRPDNYSQPQQTMFGPSDLAGQRKPSTKTSISLTPAQRADVSEDILSLGEAAMHLKRQVEELLDLTQMRSGNFNVKLEEVRLQALIARMCKDHQPMAHAPLVFEASEELENRLFLTDPFRIRQLLANGLTNACKVTTAGQITVTFSYCSAPRTSAVLKRLLASRTAPSSEHMGVSGTSKGAVDCRVLAAQKNQTAKPKDANGSVVQVAPVQGWITVAIRDSGPGLQGLDPEVLFQPYFSLLTAASRSTLGGTGLGLPIVRQLSRAMGGDVLLRDIGNGAEYFVALPMPTPAAKPSSIPASSRTASISMQSAESPQLKDATPNPSTPRRSHPGGLPPLPLEERPVAIELAPIRSPPSQFEASNQGYSTNKPSHEAQRNQATPSAFHLLIVDDAPANCRLVSRMLKSFELQQTVITSPVETTFEAAITSQLLSHNSLSRSSHLASDEPGPIRAVLLDLNLKGERGLVIFHRLKASLRNKVTFPPFFAVSGTITASDKSQLLAEGFAGTLEKPFDKKQLQELLRLLPEGLHNP